MLERIPLHKHTISRFYSEQFQRKIFQIIHYISRLLADFFNHKYGESLLTI